VGQADKVVAAKDFAGVFLCWVQIFSHNSTAAGGGHGLHQSVGPSILEGSDSLQGPAAVVAGLQRVFFDGMTTQWRHTGTFGPMMCSCGLATSGVLGPVLGLPFVLEGAGGVLQTWPATKPGPCLLWHKLQYDSG
jgi:hypothetical protein